MKDNQSEHRFLTARWVLPIAQPPRQNTVVVIDNRRIVRLIDRASFDAEYGAQEIFDYGDALIMPGLINLHTHVDYTGLRLFDTTSGFFPWILGLVR